MKNIFLVLLFLLFVLVGVSQTLTKTAVRFPNGANYLKYVGTAKDTITTNQDTIEFVVQTNLQEGYILYGTITLDTIAGKDSLVTIEILGRNFAGDNWTQLVTDNMGVYRETYNTIDYVSAAITYRWLLIRMYLPDQLASGVRIKEGELIYYNCHLLSIINLPH